jgi:hypothetical protein
MDDTKDGQRRQTLEPQSQQDEQVGAGVSEDNRGYIPEAAWQHIPETARRYIPDAKKPPSERLASATQPAEAPSTEELTPPAAELQ